ncbi:DUF2147 domain-containing protein [Alphaproteobacteria bacterium]|nr:DUF2147 domain-containing protein [Alphaproteobacteria bacterium]
MKHSIKFIQVSGLVSFFYIFVIFNASADSKILGEWIPEEKDAVYEFYACGQAICAKVIELKEPNDPETGKPKVDLLNEDETLRSRPILGMQFLDGLKKKSKTKWGDGTIYNARDGKTYTALMKLKKDGSLEVRGYVGMPMLGKSTFFTRK